MTASLLSLGCSGVGAAVANVPTRSLDFESSSSQQLSIAGSAFGATNGTTWTYHVWYKRESTGQMYMMVKDQAGSGKTLDFFFDASNRFFVAITNSVGTLIGRIVSSASFTDTTGWHQLVVYWDSNNATSTNRLRLYHDQTRITAFASSTMPTLGATTSDTADGSVYMGYSGSGNYYDGLLYQSAWFNGVNPAISTLHSSGSPVDLTGISGLISLLNTNGTDALEDDYVLSTNWTNTNTVIKSTDIPT